jgi:hypothetical protein
MPALPSSPAALGFLALLLALPVTAEAAPKTPAKKPRVVRHNVPVQRLDDPGDAPAYRAAQMDGPTCRAELAVRHVPWTAIDSARGVRDPGRLTGPIRGIAFHSNENENARATSLYEIVDCRLAVELDDFAGLLAAHDIVEVIHMSIYRPPGKGWPDGKGATRHPGGLALDAGTFVKRDGTRLVVEKDFHGRIGATTCGPGTGPRPVTPAATELRAIFCDAADRHLFTVMLSPDYNWPHRNHFHLEVTPEVTWFLVH